MSSVIVGMIALQGAVGFGIIQAVFSSYRHGYLWPFLEYPVYHAAYKKGGPIDRFALIGTLQDGREIRFTPRDMKRNFWQFLAGPVRAMQHDDPVSQRALGVRTEAPSDDTPARFKEAFGRALTIQARIPLASSERTLDVMEKRGA